MNDEPFANLSSQIKNLENLQDINVNDLDAEALQIAAYIQKERSKMASRTQKSRDSVTSLPKHRVSPSKSSKKNKMLEAAFGTVHASQAKNIQRSSSPKKNIDELSIDLDTT